MKDNIDVTIMENVSIRDVTDGERVIVKSASSIDQTSVKKTLNTEYITNGNNNAK